MEVLGTGSSLYFATLWGLLVRVLLSMASSSGCANLWKLLELVLCEITVVVVGTSLITCLDIQQQTHFVFFLLQIYLRF